MPIKTTLNTQGEPVERCHPFFVYAGVTDAGLLRLIDLKRESSNLINELNESKKLCEQTRDFDGARWFRDDIAYWTKVLRAARLVYGYFRNDLKDCPYVPISDWPVTLCKEIDYCGMVLDT